MSKADTKMTAGERCNVPKSCTEMKQQSGLRLLLVTVSAQVMRVSGCEPRDNAGD